MKVYVVMYEGWEYNDEYFYRSEIHGGSLDKVFLDKNNAIEYVEQKNLEEVTEILTSDPDNIHCYLWEGETSESMLGDKGKKYLKYFDVITPYYEEDPLMGISNNAISNVPTEDLLAIGDLLNFSSYFFKEVEAE